MIPDEQVRGGPLNARWRWTYIVLLFLLGMHSRVDERSGAVSGSGELERGMALVLKNERWMQGENILRDDVVGSCKEV